MPGHFYCRKTALMVEPGQFIEQVAAALFAAENKRRLHCLVPHLVVGVIQQGINFIHDGGISKPAQNDNEVSDIIPALVPKPRCYLCLHGRPLFDQAIHVELAHSAVCFDRQAVQQRDNGGGADGVEQRGDLVKDVFSPDLKGIENLFDKLGCIKFAAQFLKPGG